MKKFFSGLLGLSLLFSLTVSPMQGVYAALPSAESSKPVATENNRSTYLVNRLTEIKDMDKSSLTSAEKKSLRAETKSIKKELKASNQGVYLSIGAIIIIILLLILIL